MLALVGAMLGGCDDNASRADDATASPSVPAVTVPLPPDGDETTSTSGPTVVFLGDSLTAGYGLGEDQAFPALIADTLAGEDRPIRVVNAGVSGDTTAGGAARLDWLLRQTPEVLVVGLGANDGLRGLDPEMSEANLRLIIERAQAADVVVVLLGMLLPPNYGPDYIEQFSAIYPRLAEAYDVILVPFMLEGVGGEPELNLPDGIHPNAEGHEIVARTLLPSVREALARTADD